jgi:hypothetical protein
MSPGAARMSMIARSVITMVIFSAVAAFFAPMPALAADDSKVKGATEKVETGARKIGHGEVGQGVTETAKGIGETVSEGAKYTGEKLKESGQAAEAPAKSAWQNMKDGARDFGRSVKSFFTKLFS